MDTDSVAHDTNINVGGVDIEVEKLFHQLNHKQDVLYLNDSEYIFPSDLHALSYNEGEGENMEVDYIYRHKVDKQMFEIEDEDGNVVRITGDHSLMVERDGNLMEVKPSELLSDDRLISFF